MKDPAMTIYFYIDAIAGSFIFYVCDILALLSTFGYSYRFLIYVFPTHVSTRSALASFAHHTIL